MRHTGHGHDVAVDDVMNCFLISNVSELFHGSGRHSDIIDQNSYFQFGQFSFKETCKYVTAAKLLSQTVGYFPILHGKCYLSQHLKVS